MSLCDFFPDDPSCAPVGEEEVIIGPVEEEDNVEEPFDDEVAVDDAGEDGPSRRRTGGSWAEEMANVEGLSKIAMASPMAGNLAYLSVGLINTVEIALGLFRYSEKDQYKAGLITSGQPNWWELSSTINNYGFFAVFSVLTVTQLLATFGIAVDINMMAWEYLWGLGGLLLGMTVYLLRFLGLNDAYSYYGAGLECLDLTDAAEAVKCANALTAD